jgi:hypothetical protein
MKWGERYGAVYVNRLASMVRRNTARPSRIVCFTDDAEGIDGGVETAPLPPISIPEREQWSPWRKISLWQAPLLDLEGDVLFLDLDVVVTGGIDDFFDFEPGRYCVAKNWSEPKLNVGNTSVYRFPVGAMRYIFDDFNRDPERYIARYRIEQKYISGEAHDQVFWPERWCLSFKHSLLPRWPRNFLSAPKLPADAKVIAFTGKPDPDEALAGHWPVEQDWKRVYKHVRPTPWIGEHWR